MVLRRPARDVHRVMRRGSSLYMLAAGRVSWKVQDGTKKTFKRRSPGGETTHKELEDIRIRCMTHDIKFNLSPTKMELMSKVLAHIPEKR
uniref:Uncharacterized protein n=1 Tax=Timema shepardi TaxID=629360 RepID=A0A7R9G6K4_TIMSH|nr:unnamed protein product [Timema shepardi]